MESVIQRHPFVDGNKRTGLLAATFSLEEEGYAVKASQKELADVSVEVADHDLDVVGLAAWLESRAVPSVAP
jgi:death-on-curing protein